MALSTENGVVDIPGDTTNEATEEVNLDASLDSTTPEEEKLHQQMKEEIDALEFEINALREALTRKERRLGDLKRELGLTRWCQIKHGIGQKYQSVQNSEMYGKISQGAQTTKVAIGDAGAKTSAALKNFGSATAKKWQEIRESQRFQSMEGKLWATTSAVKAKIGGTKEQETLTPAEPPSEKEPSAI